MSYERTGGVDRWRETWAPPLRAGAWRRHAQALSSWLPLILIVAFGVLWPIATFQIQSFVAGGWNGIVSAYSETGIGRTIGYTVAIAIADLVFAVVVGTGLALCVLRLSPRWRSVGSIIPLVPLIIPAIAAVIGWIFLLTPRVGYLNVLLRKLPIFEHLTNGPFDIYTFSGIVFISGLLLSSFIFMFVLNGMRSIGGDLQEAAAIAGASPVKIFFTITLPQLRPSLAYGGGIVTMLAVGQFSTVILLSGPARIDVLTTNMFYKLQVFPVPFTEVAALGLPLLLAGALVLVAQRWVIGDPRRYMTIGGRAQRHTTYEPVWWAAAAIAIYGVLAIMLPLCSLLYTSFTPFWSGALRFDNLSLANFTSILSNPYLLSAFQTTIVSALLTLLVVLPLGYWAARILAFRTAAPAFVARVLDILILLPYALPAVLFGFALLFAYTNPPFMLYGTKAIIVIAYCTIMIPYSTRLLLAQLMSLGVEPWEASSVSGAGPIRTFLHVTVPLMRRSASAAAAVICILLFQEFGVSLLVRTASVQVIGGVLYDQYLAGSYPNVAVIAVLMVGVAVAGVASMLIFGGGDAFRKVGTRES